MFHINIAHATSLNCYVFQMKLKDCVCLASTSLPPTFSLSTLNNFVNELIATNSNALSNNMKKTGIVCFKVCNELIYLSL